MKQKFEIGDVVIINTNEAPIGVIRNWLRISPLGVGIVDTSFSSGGNVWYRVRNNRSGLTFKAQELILVSRNEKKI